MTRSAVRSRLAPPAFARFASYGWASPIVAKAASPQPFWAKAGSIREPSLLRRVRLLRLGKPYRSEGCLAAARLGEGGLYPRTLTPSQAAPATAGQALSERRLPRRGPFGRRRALFEDPHF